jgi:long-chain acyl-CoA synthetase
MSGLANPCTVRQLVDRQAEQAPERAWIVATDTGAVISRGRLQEQCQELGRVLLMNGMQAGDRVLLMMDNGYQTARLLIGVMYSGLLVQPLDLQAGDAALDAALAAADCRLVFAAHDQVARLRGPLTRAAERDAQDIALFPLNPDQIDIFDDPYIAHVPLPALSPDDPAFMGCTLDASGMPRAQLWTHQALMDAASDVAQNACYRGTDHVTMTQPLCSSVPDPMPLIAALAGGGCMQLAHLLPGA